MAAPLEAGAYKEIILFLATAGIVVPLFSKLRVSPVLGFIGAGILLGPPGLGRLVPSVPWLGWITIANSEQVTHLAEFGVVFLLFTIGLELSFERLRTLRRLVFGLGAAQVAVSSLALAAIGVLAGLRPGQAALCGIALALSSTAMVVPILAGQRRLNSPSGRTSFSVLLFQDLAVAPVLFTVTAVDAAQGGSILPALSLALVQAAAAVLVLIVVGRLALRPLFQVVAQTRSPELFMATCLLVVVGTAVLAASNGLSMALGAFVAGLLLAETEYRRAIEAMVDPFKGLLLGVFFVTIGMSLDPSAILLSPALILAAALGLIVVKAAIVIGLAAALRLPRRVGLETGLLLGPGGEFAFVLLGAAMAAQLVPAATGQFLLIVTTLTMIAIPLIARLARQIGHRVGQAGVAEPQFEAPPGELANHVIIAGFGRVGQLVADMLERHKVPYIALDMNPALLGQKRAGRPLYFGDMTSPMVLRACGLETARALVITLDRPAAIPSIVEIAREARPDLTIVSRARDDRHARELYALGVNDAVPETIEASLQLSEAVLVDIGIAMGPVIASIHERRDEYRRDFQAASGGKPTAATPAADAAAPRRAGEFRSRRSAGRRAADGPREA